MIMWYVKIFRFLIIIEQYFSSFSNYFMKKYLKHQKNQPTEIYIIML